MNQPGFLARLRRGLSLALRPDAGAMVLRQPHLWSRLVLWIIVGVTIGTILWAFLAPMDEVVHALGKLEPRGSVLDVQSPVEGVVERIHVREGEAVERGQILITIESEAAEARVEAIEKQLAPLRREQEFYTSLTSGSDAPPAAPPMPEVLGLAKDRAALLEEARLLRRLLDEITLLQEAIRDSGKKAANGATNAEDTVATRLQELSDLVEGEVRKLDALGLDRDNIRLFQAKLADLLENYVGIREQLEEANSIEENKRKAHEKFLELHDGGNLSRVDQLAHEAAWFEARARVAELVNRAKNLPTTFASELTDRLNENSKRIAEIDRNNHRILSETKARIAELESSLTSARQELDRHRIRSPIAGIAFEIVPGKPGAVVFSKDVVLKVVPSEDLIAKVDITNSDIGFVSIGMPCEVEVDSFPKREFGYIDGEVFFVGSDALPPDEVRPYYSFPVKISLDKQFLRVRGKDITLTSGMSVNVNIKIRKRKVANIFLDNLLGPVESLSEVR